MAEDWRGFSVPGWAVKRVDLWRFLDCCPMGMEEFGRALNEEARQAGSGERGARNVLLGYSMGGRLALHALLQGGPWDAAVIVSAHPGLEEATERVARRERDAEWAARALKGEWREFLEEWDSQPVLAGRVHDRDGHATTLAMADRKKLEIRRQAVARSFVDWSLGNQEPLAGRIGEIDCPVLWVVGEKDAKFRALADALADRSVRPPLCWIAPGVGHRVPWDSTEFPAKVV